MASSPRFQAAWAWFATYVFNGLARVDSNGVLAWELMGEGQEPRPTQETRSTRCCGLPELNMLTERKAEETMFKSNGPLAQCIRGSVVAVSFLCLIQDGAIGEGAESSRRWGRVARFRAEMKEQAVPEMKRPNPYDTYKQWYPRYEGAFHSRYFNDLGIPPGDVGLRGNGLTMTPW